MTLREQVGARVERLATQRLRSGEVHHLEVTVRGRRITVQVDDGTPMAASLDPALDQGAVDFGIAARGPQPQALAFLGPRLTDLRPRPPASPPANQQPQPPQAQG